MDSGEQFPPLDHVRGYDITLTLIIGSNDGIITRLSCCTGNRDANEPGAGAVGNGVWGSDGVSASEASIALLRRDLIEAQQEAKFWKERAETLRVENLRTNIELESTRKDLSQAQAELIRELRTKLGELLDIGPGQEYEWMWFL